MSTSARNARLVLATAVAASALLLTGCSVTPTAPNAEYPGFPEGVEAEGAEGEPQAAWLDYGQKIAITLFGSSTCPPIGNKITVLEEAFEGNAVGIELEPLPDRPCTMDYVPHTTVFWTPEDVTTTEPLLIAVQDQLIVLPIK